VTTWHLWPGGGGTKAAFLFFWNFLFVGGSPPLHHAIPPSFDIGHPHNHSKVQFHLFPLISTWFHLIPLPGGGGGAVAGAKSSISSSRPIVPNRAVLMIPAPQQRPFLSLLRLFAANQWKRLSWNYLHITRGFPDQAQSSLIKILFSLASHSGQNSTMIPSLSEGNGPVHGGLALRISAHFHPRLSCFDGEVIGCPIALDESWEERLFRSPKITEAACGCPIAGQEPEQVPLAPQAGAHQREEPAEAVRPVGEKGQVSE